MFRADTTYEHTKLENLAVYVYSYVYENDLYTLNVLWLAKKSKKLILAEFDQLTIPSSQISEWSRIE